MKESTPLSRLPPFSAFSIILTWSQRHHSGSVCGLAVSGNRFEPCSYLTEAAPISESGRQLLCVIDLAAPGRSMGGPKVPVGISRGPTPNSFDCMQSVWPASTSACPARCKLTDLPCDLMGVGRLVADDETSVQLHSGRSRRVSQRWRPGLNRWARQNPPAAWARLSTLYGVV